jgi:hypothetical protein
MGAALALLRTEVALQRYRAAHGRCPPALRDLEPGLPASALLDPFGGAERPLLRYRPEHGGGGYLLYSVGPDMRDDGGMLPRRASGDQGDLVAGRLFERRRRRP